MRVDESIVEVENQFNRSMTADDNSFLGANDSLNESMIKPQDGWLATELINRIGAKVETKITAISPYVHSTIAVTLNILAILTSKPFDLLP
jgi:hypothetical protein